MKATLQPSVVDSVGEMTVPLQRAGEGWLLMGRSGQIPITDPRAVSELDALAAALAAADRAVATATTCGPTAS